MDLAFRSEKGAPAVNEDLCLAQPDIGLFVVCDGLGRNGTGKQASESAAQILLDSVRGNLFLIEGWRKDPQKDARVQASNLLQNAMQEASKKIYQDAGTRPELQGMCTTIDAILFMGMYALVAHVGSGRVYLLRQKEIHQITEDHTYLAHMKRTGKVDALTEAQRHQHARRLTRAVGFQEDVRTDVLEVELEPGDRFLMLSDGVWSVFSETEMSALGAKQFDPPELLAALHSGVKAKNERDNYTTLIVSAPTGFEKEENIPANLGGAEQKIRMLGKVPAFEYLSYQELIKVLSVSELVKIAPQQVICNEGDPGGELMLILSGEVSVVKNKKKIRKLIHGDVFGEMSMLDESPRSASVIADQATNLLAFPRKTLFELCLQEPELAVKFVWGLSMEMNKRFRMVSNQLVGRPEMEGIVHKVGTSFPFHRSK